MSYMLPFDRVSDLLPHRTKPLAGGNTDPPGDLGHRASTVMERNPPCR